MFYVLVSTYLGVSAKQIKLGYTVFPGNDVVSKEYSVAGSVAFKSFRLIPYVREMRSILEWMFADTSLDIFMWLKFDDLYAWLLAVRYDKAYRKRSKKILSGDEGQSLLWKILYGWIVSSSTPRNGNQVMGNHSAACQEATSGTVNEN